VQRGREGLEFLKPEETFPVSRNPGFQEIPGNVIRTVAGGKLREPIFPGKAIENVSLEHPAGRTSGTAGLAEELVHVHTQVLRKGQEIEGDVPFFTEAFHNVSCSRVRARCDSHVHMEHGNGIPQGVEDLGTA